MGAKHSTVQDIFMESVTNISMKESQSSTCVESQTNSAIVNATGPSEDDRSRCTLACAAVQANPVNYAACVGVCSPTVDISQTSKSQTVTKCGMKSVTQEQIASLLKSAIAQSAKVKEDAIFGALASSTKTDQDVVMKTITNVSNTFSQKCMLKSATENSAIVNTAMMGVTVKQENFKVAMQSCIAQSATTISAMSGLQNFADNHSAFVQEFPIVGEIADAIGMSVQTLMYVAGGVAVALVLLLLLYKSGGHKKIRQMAYAPWGTRGPRPPPQAPFAPGYPPGYGAPAAPPAAPGYGAPAPPGYGGYGGPPLPQGAR